MIQFFKYQWSVNRYQWSTHGNPFWWGNLWKTLESSQKIALYNILYDRPDIMYAYTWNKHTRKERSKNITLYSDDKPQVKWNCSSKTIPGFRKVFKYFDKNGFLIVFSWNGEIRVIWVSIFSSVLFSCSTTTFLAGNDLQFYK